MPHPDFPKIETRYELTWEHPEYTDGEEVQSTWRKKAKSVPRALKHTRDFYGGTIRVYKITSQETAEDVTDQFEPEA